MLRRDHFKKSPLLQLHGELHQLRLRFKNMPQASRALLIISTLTACFIVYRLLVYLLVTDLSYHTDWRNCPACYGTRMCKRIHETSVHGKEKSHHLNRLVNVKNVYFGSLNNEEFVFKKLAHDNELSKIDEYLCRGGLTECKAHHSKNNKFCVKSASQSEQSSSCDIRDSVSGISGRLTGPLLVEEVEGLSEAVHCPSPRLMKRMVHRFQERGEFVHEDGLSKQEKFMLLYTLTVNPEPIILQLFPHGEGWPFPAYIGACGRMIAEQNSGAPLREYFNADWKTRIILSLKLLRIADQLTDNSAAFKLYFSDLSYDNYAVNKNSLEVVISDAENIIIVDEQHLQQGKPAGFDKTYRSVFDECAEGANCLSIDIEALCGTVKADFNYYALCRSILSSYAQDEKGMNGGLLHSLPDSLPQAQLINSLADQCAQPLPTKDRFVVKEELMRTLEAVVKTFSNNFNKATRR